MVAEGLTRSLTASATNLVEEGNNVAFTVTPSAASATAVTLYVQISGASVGAITSQAAADDFSAVLLPITIPAGSTAPVTVSATVNADTTTEGPEGFQAKLLDSGFVAVAGSTTITGTITEGVTSGKTYMLAKALDNVPGTSGNDTIIGSISATPGDDLDTLSTLDIVNGGAGVDTLKIATAISNKTVTLPNLSNVEIIELQGSGTGGTTTIDTTTVTGLTDVKVTKMAEILAAKAGATTNVAVEMKAADKAVGVVGGNNVTVKLTDVTTNNDVVTIGGATTAAKGDVVVEMTGAKTAANADATLSAVTVTGGKTISVTQKATSDSSAAATDKTGTTITQATLTVNGDASTTTVTVKQDAAVTEVVAKDAVVNKDATYAITFNALAKGEKAVLVDSTGGSLTFTASKALSAAEVASAFANLGKGVLQGNASAKLGEFSNTGTALPKWLSGAVEVVDADNAKVTFSATGAEAGTLANTGSTAGKVTVATKVTGLTKIDAVTGVLGVDTGKVVIEDSATHTVKTITVDGYANTSTIGAGTATTALETLTLKNAQGTASMTVADTAATLGLTVEKLGAAAVLDAKTGAVTTAQVDAVVTLTAAPTTLNVTSTGNNFINLTAAATETLNVSGTGLLDINTTDLAAVKTVKVSGTAGLTLNAGVADTVTSVDTTGTTGTTTITIEGDRATYSGGAGVDNVTVKNANVAMTKAISLGAGDDKLTLNTTSGNIAAPTVTLDGGTGTNTIAMTNANAVEATKNGNLAAKIDNFQKLEITDKQTVAGTVNLANLDNISYVISKGSDTAAAAATKTSFTLDVTGSAATATDTVAFNGSTYAFTGAAATATSFATQLYALIVATPPVTGTWVATGVSGTKITFEAVTAGVLATPANTAFVFVDVDSSTSAVTFATAEVSAGAAAGGAVITQTIDKLASGGTLELNDVSDGVIVQVTDATTNLTDVLNIVTSAATTSDVGQVTANKVETINIEAKDTIHGTDVSTNTLTIDADKAVTVNVKGAGDLVLDFTAASKALTTVDGSTATGKLNITSVKNDGENLVIKGGLAADTLTSAGQNDKLFGNEGADKLKAAGTIALVELNGGTGIDSYDVSTASSKTAASVVRITNFEKGETIKFVANADASFLGSKFEMTGAAGLSDYVGQALAAATAYADDLKGAATSTKGIAWFQFGGNTYIAQDVDGNDAFSTGDIVVEITGQVDLSASSFNDNLNGSLLFI